MTVATANSLPDSAQAGLPGPSADTRRFSAGIRVVTALLCTALLLNPERAANWPVLTVLLAYGLWAGWLLWGEANGYSRAASVGLYWIDVAWSCLCIQLVDDGTRMFIITMVHPVVLASINHGVRHGMLLATFGALGIAAEGDGALMHRFTLGWAEVLSSALVLALVPAASMIARPMSALRQRMALLGELEARLDPRRGLEPTCIEVVERLRSATGADLVALLLPSERAAPAMFATRNEGTFRARDDMHTELERQLSGLPKAPQSYARRAWWDLRPAVVLHDERPVPRDLAAALAALARTLEVDGLHVVPLTRYDHDHGYFVIGYAGRSGASQDGAVLASSAPELLRIIEQAALVDQLQEESASHERARIGRDLHDSAIQPYLGLKYAVEVLALRMAADNPARAEVDALAAMVNSEVYALRELISGLRSGNMPGDRALVTAVRRQVRRFALLFGIDVQLDSPQTLPTTRVLASALFHIVNEALNNVRKHSAATRVWVTLSAEPGLVRLTVRDDAGSVRGRPVDDFHPSSIAERVAELRGILHITRPDGLNTELSIEVPVWMPQADRVKIEPRGQQQ